MADILILRRPVEQCRVAEVLLKYTFAALLKKREEDLAFFDQRIEKGLVAAHPGATRGINRVADERPRVSPCEALQGAFV
jgi:hypothetical protein